MFKSYIGIVQDTQIYSFSHVTETHEVILNGPDTLHDRVVSAVEADCNFEQLALRTFIAETQYVTSRSCCAR